MVTQPGLGDVVADEFRMEIWACCPISPDRHTLRLTVPVTAYASRDHSGWKHHEHALPLVMFQLGQIPWPPFIGPCHLAGHLLCRPLPSPDLSRKGGIGRARRDQVFAPLVNMVSVVIHALCHLGLTAVLEDGHPSTETNGACSFGHLATRPIAHTCEDSPEPANHSKWKAGRVTQKCKLEIDFLSPKWPAVYMSSRVWCFIMRWSCGLPCGITSWALVSISMFSSMLVLLMTYSKVLERENV